MMRGDDASPPARGYRLDVQGLRTVAVVAVILFHARDLLPGGYVGVDVFFVISGFVITRSLLREHSSAGRVALRDFYRRRVRRLFPALTLVVVTTVALTLLLGPLATSAATARTGAATLVFGANLELLGGTGYFDTTAELNPLLHTWSLSLEEQFYLVFPGVVALLLHVGRRRGRVALPVGLFALGAGSLAVSLVLAHGGALGDLGLDATRQLGFFLMPSRFWQFVVGALLAIACRRDDARLAVPGLGTLGVVALAASFVLFGDLAGYPGAFALVPTLAAAAIIADPSSRVADVLARPAMVAAGGRSYSWYLWHWPVISFVDAAGVESPLVLAAVGLASYPLAELTYRFVEVPYVRERPRAGRAGDAWRAIAATTAVAAVAVWGVVLLPDLTVGGSVAAAATDATIVPLDESCAEVRIERAVQGCVLGAGRVHTVLLGDSNAGHFADAVTDATAGGRLTILTRSGCPAVDVEIRRDGVPDDRCRRVAAARRAWVVDQAPDLVVLATAADVYLELDMWELSRGAARGAEAYRGALVDFIVELQAVGTEVVIVHPVPKFALAEPRPGALGTCSAVTAVLDLESCILTSDRAAASARRAAAVGAERAAVRATGATALDPFDLLCPADPCSELRDGVWQYRDEAHISVPASRALGGWFASGLAPRFGEAAAPTS